MYAWLYRILPGPAWLRALILLLMFAAVVVVLFTVVFPWAEQEIPFLQVTVDTPSGG